MTWLRSRVAALVLLGARLAQHHRIDRLEMRRVGRQREMDDVAVELAVGRGAEVVLHVARAAHLLGLRGAALELGEQRGVALVHDVARACSAGRDAACRSRRRGRRAGRRASGSARCRGSAIRRRRGRSAWCRRTSRRDSAPAPRPRRRRSQDHACGLRRVNSVRFSMCSMRSWIHAFWSGSEMCMYSTPILPQ